MRCSRPQPNKRPNAKDGHSASKKQKCLMTCTRVSTFVTVLGDDEIQRILKFLCKEDLLRVALVCKSMESQVEELYGCVLQKVRSHHKLPPPLLPSESWKKVSLRRELQQTMKNPLYHVNLPENQGVWGCRTLALSPSEDQLAIADIALEQSGDQDAYKVIVWDLSRKQVLQTIHHKIVPAEHSHGGNYSLKLFWMANDLLVTCSPASICVWSPLTGRRLHCYCRYPKSTAPSRLHDSCDMMHSFVRKDDTKILFLADKNSVHSFDAQHGRVQESICSATSLKMKMRDLMVCHKSFLIVLLSQQSRNQGLLVVDLERSRMVQFFPGNYCSISQASPSSRTVLAFRVDGDDRTGRTRFYVDILELSDSGMLLRRRMVPFDSATTQVMAASEDQFFARDLVNKTKIKVFNSKTGEFESSFKCDDRASFFPHSTIVAPRRKELMIGLDIESGSSATAVFSLLDVSREIELVD